MTFSIFPRTVYKTESKISGEIIVKEQLGKYTLHVGGLIQSGGIIEGIWKKALKQAIELSSNRAIRRVLVLGLGGGTVVQLIKVRYPEAKIVGIEIDSEIIKIGKKFFGLGEIKNLKIINADAIKTINNKQLSINDFDLAVVDLYLGGKFPKKAEDDEFLGDIKKILSQDGTVIFNRLKIDETRGFGEKLKKHFFQTETVEASTNLFFLARL